MRLMSGRLRAYAATMPAMAPVENSTSISSVTSRLPQKRLIRRRRPVLLRMRYGTQDPVDKPPRILGREALGKRHGFVDRHRSGSIGATAEFERSHLQQQPVDRRQPFDRPAFE